MDFHVFCFKTKETHYSHPASQGEGHLEGRGGFRVDQVSSRAHEHVANEQNHSKRNTNSSKDIKFGEVLGKVHDIYPYLKSGSRSRCKGLTLPTFFRQFTQDFLGPGVRYLAVLDLGQWIHDLMAVVCCCPRGQAGPSSFPSGGLSWPVVRGPSLTMASLGRPYPGYAC